MGKVRKILFVICLIVFLVSAFMLAKYFYTGHVVQKEFKQLEEEYSLEELYAENSDTFGWVKIADTKLSYPVMFTPVAENDPEFYLRKNFQKEYSAAGTPFLDGYTDLENSSNWTIYGHHMKDGTMFRTLLDYDEEGFYELHPVIELDTVNYGKHRYQIFAFGKTDALAEGFNVYNYTNITDEYAFNEYVNGLKNMCSYDTGVTPQYGQKIITLSTCSYHSEEGRYVVAAVEID